MFATLFTQGYFRVNMNHGGWFKLRLAIAAATFEVTASLVALWMLRLSEPQSRHFVLVIAGLSATAVLCRLVGRYLLERAWKKGRLRASALLIGYDQMAQELVGRRRERTTDLAVLLVTPSSQ